MPKKMSAQRSSAHADIGGGKRSLKSSLRPKIDLAAQKAPPSAKTSDRIAPPRSIARGALPQASLTKAHKVFGNFSLSRFPKKADPAQKGSSHENYVGEKKDPPSVHAAQEKVISRNLATLRSSAPPTGGLTLDIPSERLKELFPHLDSKAQQVKLSDVLSVLNTKMQGTEFYSGGNPTLTRITRQLQAEQIVKSIKRELKK